MGKLACANLASCKPEQAPHYHVYGGKVLSWMDADDNVSSVCDGMGRVLLAMNGRGYTVLHVHNESSASGQAPEEEGPGRRVQRSQLRLAPPNGIP